MSIRLKRGRFLSGGKLYKPGDILPDTAQALVERGDAEIVEAPPTPAQKTSRADSSPTMTELVKEAKARGLDVPKGMSKAELLELLRAASANEESPGDAAAGDS